MFVCLLPARNCADDLPGYFESVGRFADAVVALDDGSTDDTRDVLDAHPLVERVLTNPRRADYRGWDDGANRNGLLEAAAELEPEWVISLDADERIDPTDALAMRAFVDTCEAHGDAYLLRQFRMIDGLNYYDEAYLWVGRLFPFERGQSFPPGRLHAVPLPTSIARDRWRRTTFRIQHLSSTTEPRRRARFQKYREADPECAFQADYSHLLDPPGRLVRWWPRPTELPVVYNTRSYRPPSSGGPSLGDAPVISVIVVALDDGPRIEGTVASILQQRVPESFEVIVAHTGDRVGERLRVLFPALRLAALDETITLGAARNAAAAAARGRYVTFVEGDWVLPAGSLAACIRTHELGYAMVSGTPRNTTRSASGWAAHFLEYSSVLPNTPASELRRPPRRCSYLRAALLDVGGFDDSVADDVVDAVNAELFERGYGAYHDPSFVTIERNECRNPIRLVRHRFGRGRQAARHLLDDRFARRWRRSRRVLGLMVLVVPRRLVRITGDVWRWGGSTRRWYLVAFPLVVVGVISEWLGGCVEIPRRARARRRTDA
jgi:glycosyltransferase involved in cell wall biosynthesis